MMPGWPALGTGDGAGMGSGMMDVDTEADYLVAMIPHHEEAIVAAEELARSDRPEMRELGEADRGLADGADRADADLAGPSGTPTPTPRPTTSR